MTRFIVSELEYVQEFESHEMSKRDWRKGHGHVTLATYILALELESSFTFISIRIGYIHHSGIGTVLFAKDMSGIISAISLVGSMW